MSNILLLKRKIKTAQNISKTTRAMQMIAASKLNKAQLAALSSRPFVEKITELTKRVSHKIEDEKKHKYMMQSESNSTLLILFTPDKGLCGGMVTNAVRQLLDFDSNSKTVSYIAVGKKAESALASFNKQMIASFDFGTILPSFDQVFPLIKLIDDLYLNSKVGAVKIIYTDFKNVFSQSPKTVDLLPIQIDSKTNISESSVTLFEPSPDEMLPFLLRKYLEMNLFQFFLENYLSEQAARMIAMQNATDNAKELIKELKLLYNKGRQEKITNEILDISSGAFFTYGS
jgi:F-type H+-transporting ATPase subunit gamma